MSIKNEKIWDEVFRAVLRAGRLWTPDAGQYPTDRTFFAPLPDGRNVEVEIKPVGHPCEASLDWRVQRTSTHTAGGGYCLAYWLPDRGWKLMPGAWPNTSRVIRRRESGVNS